MSGEDTIKSAPQYIVPIVKLHGEEGKFYKFITNEDAKEGEKRTIRIELGEQISGVMLKVRRSFSEFTKSYSRYTNEHNSWKDKVSLFERGTKGGRSQLITEGTIQELREKYPNLKMRQSIYFLLGLAEGEDVEVVKLVVKGKGLSYLFDYWKEFKPNEHIYEFETVVGIGEETNEALRKNYFAMSFQRGKKLNVEQEMVVEEKIKEVFEGLEKVEAFYADNKPVVEEEVVEEEGMEDASRPIIRNPKKRIDPKDGFPIIEEEEAINIKDIPF